MAEEPAIGFAGIDYATMTAPTRNPKVAAMAANVTKRVEPRVCCRHMSQGEA